MRALKICLTLNTSALNSCAQRACALKVSKITSTDLLLMQVNYVECNNSTVRLAWHCLSHNNFHAKIELWNCNFENSKIMIFGLKLGMSENRTLVQEKNFSPL